MASENPQAELATRAGSQGSNRSTASKKQNPQQQLSQIEKSVTHLLVATKQLLETLTQWSRGSATEGEVSDVYVRLGYEFNIACRAFNAIGVDTQDLGPVPDLLRSILEDTLSQEASQSSLDRFLPRIRDIIISLLQGLKKKQSRLRARTARELERNSSERPLSSFDDPQASLPPTVRKPGGSKDGIATDLPPRTSSRNEGRSASPNRHDANATAQPRLNSTNLHTSDSSMSSATAQSIPVLAPYPPNDSLAIPIPMPIPMPMPMPDGHPQPPPHATPRFPQPPAPPAKQDALLALQRGGDLERRASRRFSTYQISKQLGTNGIILPPAQNSPAPNRGREVQESIQAVRQRTSQTYNRQKSERRLLGESSPPRNGAPRISVPPYDVNNNNNNDDGDDDDDDKDGDQNTAPSSTSTTAPPSYAELDSNDNANFGATVSGPIEEPVIIESTGLRGPAPIRNPSRKVAAASTPPPHHYVTDESPQPGKELTLFLQYKGKVKKFILEDGYNDLSVARLQLAFIDKFAWNTHSNGVDLPEIYIQDSVTGVRYELEDLNDIKNNTVLVLNVEPLDEVKRHIDNGLGGLRRVVEGIKTAVDGQQSAIQRINDRQQETQKDVASLANNPPTARTLVQSVPGISLMSPTRMNKGSLQEIQALRRNLAVLRQSYSSLVSDVEASMAAVKVKASSVKSVAITAALPSLSGESGRAYVNAGLYDNMAKDQTVVVERVDDVQDLIEDLRKDVVTRGVRPLPRQLEQVAKDLGNATSEVKKLEAYLEKEKPLWSKIWKQELQQVCDDREAIAETEALIIDMKLDLEESEKTFRLVEEACKQQNIMASTQPGASVVAGGRSTSGGRVPGLLVNSMLDPMKAKDGLLIEVKGLQVDHESRLEAIERAERNRLKELESRKEGAFKRELGSFVEEGKLKRSGGVEEAERLRKAKDDRIRREVWDRQNGKGVPPGDGSSERSPGDSGDYTQSENSPNLVNGDRPGMAEAF